MQFIQSVDLSVYPMVAMAIFLSVFTLVVVRACRMNRHSDVDALARLALEEDSDSTVTEVSA